MLHKEWRNKHMEAKRFLQQAKFYYKGRKAAYNTEEFTLMQIAYPLLTMIFYCLLASYSFQTSNLGYWVIGNSFLLCTNACIYGLGTIFVGERFNGRLRSIIASPYNKLLLISANGVYPALTAIISSSIGMIVGTLVFQIDFSGVNIFMVVIAIIVAMFSASAFGLFLAVFGLISDNIQLVLNLFSILLMIMSGAEFPIENLPYNIRWLCWLFPLTKAIKAIDNLFGNNSSAFFPLLIGELFSCFVFILLARLLLAWAERKARIMGTIDLF